MSVLHRPIWERDGGVVLPRLDRSITVDTCVVGLGGSGLAAILDLIGRGQRVAGIDAVGVASGAAGRNGGFLLAGSADFHHDAVAALGRQRATAIYRHTMAELDRMTAETPEAIERCGSLRIASDDAELADCQAQYVAMRDDGLPCEHHEGVEGMGLLFPHDGTFNPARRCALLAHRAIAGGAQLYAPASAAHIESGSVTVGAHRISCNHVLVLTDGALPVVLPDLASRVRVARLQMIATAPLEQALFTRPVYYRYGYEYWQQLPDRSLVLGGFRDRAGEGEWTTSDAPGAVVQDMLDVFLREHLCLDVPVTHRWAASVGYTDSVLPFVGEVRHGVWAAGGYNGTGNIIGTICARALAERITTGVSATLELFGG